MKIRYLILYIMISLLYFACNSDEINNVDSVIDTSGNIIDKKLGVFNNINKNADEDTLKTYLIEYNPKLYKELQKQSRDFLDMQNERDSTYFFQKLTGGFYKINLIRYLDKKGERTQYLCDYDSIIVIRFGRNFNIYDIERNIIGRWEIKTYKGVGKNSYDTEELGLEFYIDLIAPKEDFAYYEMGYFQNSEIFHIENSEIYRKYVLGTLDHGGKGDDNN